MPHRHVYRARSVVHNRQTVAYIIVNRVQIAESAAALCRQLSGANSKTTWHMFVLHGTAKSLQCALSLSVVGWYWTTNLEMTAFTRFTPVYFWLNRSDSRNVMVIWNAWYLYICPTQYNNCQCVPQKKQYNVNLSCVMHDTNLMWGIPTPPWRILYSLLSYSNWGCLAFCGSSFTASSYTPDGKIKITTDTSKVHNACKDCEATMQQRQHRRQIISTATIPDF